MQDFVGEFATTFDSYGLNNYNLANNEWHHIALVVDRTNNFQYYYIDGVLAGTKDIANFGREIGNDGAVKIGFQENSPGGSVNIDDVAFFNHVLSGQEIAFLASQPLANAIPEPSSFVLLGIGLGALGLAGARGWIRKRNILA